MNGIEILSSEEVAIAWESWNWTGFWVAVGIAFAAALVAGLVFYIQERDVLCACILFAVMLMFCTLVFGLIGGQTMKEPTEYETHYKVTIDDSVSMSEFMDKYEVVDQEGKIYTVRERE